MKTTKSLFFSFIIILMVAILTYSPLLPSAKAYSLGVGDAKVISSVCDVYSEADFKSDKLEIKFKFGDKVEVISLQGEFAKVSLEEGEGYIYKYYLTQNSDQDVYPVFNATIRNKTEILDINEEPSGYVAKKGDRVYLYNGFNDKDKCTFVQIVLEDGSLYVGKIKTQDIKPDGISGLLIAGISIIVAAVTIILSLVFIRKHKKKKQEN